MISDVSVAILAGGQSRRMGTDKSFIQLDDKPLIQHVFDRVSALNLPVTIIANLRERYLSFGVPVYADVLPGKGSLGGIYTALRYSPTPFVLCVACDMPFLNPELLSYLIGLRESYHAVVPLVNGERQGLHAIYNRDCMRSIEKQLERDDLRIHNLFRRIRTRVVTQSSIAAIDPQFRSFVNLNTPNDISQIKPLESGDTR